MARTDVDFVAWDNSDPPQLWAWSGTYGDESSEALFRLPAEGLRGEWDDAAAEIERLQNNMWEVNEQSEFRACLIDKLDADLTKCRKLLREACEAICSELQPSMAYDRFMIRREWRVEAMKTAGGDDE